MQNYLDLFTGGPWNWILGKQLSLWNNTCRGGMDDYIKENDLPQKAACLGRERFAKPTFALALGS